MKETLILIISMFLIALIISSCQPKSIPELLQQQDQISIGINTTIRSKILNEDRDIQIHVPEGFYGMNEKDVQYSVVVVVDGENLFLPTVATMNQLSSPFTANDQAPQMIVVGITHANRNWDLTPTAAVMGRDSSSLENTGGANQLAEFIDQELLPYIDQNYPTTNHRTLIGHSLGGLFVLNTLAKHPNLFSNYISLDPDMSWDNRTFMQDVLRDFSTDQFDRKKLYLAIANNGMPWMTKEDMLADTTDILRITSSLLAFSDALDNISPKSLSIEQKYYESDDHFTMVQPSILDGLKYLYSAHSFSEMAEYYYPDSPQSKTDIVAEIKSHFTEVSADLGYEAKPSEAYLNAWAFGFLQLGKPNQTAHLLDLNIDYYPSSAHVYEAKGYFLSTQEDTLGAIHMYEKSLEIENFDYIRERIRELQ